MDSGRNAIRSLGDFMEIRGVIDFHVHITRDLDDCRTMVEAARRSGIDLICVSSLGDKGYIHNPSPDQFRSANDYVLRAMDEFPDRVIGFCYLNPNYPDESIEEMDRCILRGGMRGVKLWVACKASDPKLDGIVRRAMELDVPILQHSFNKSTGNLPNESRPEDVAELARRFPQAKIVMAHLHGNGYKGVAEVADLKNVFIDLCGSDPESGLVEYAVDVLGADRLIFGSDAPGRNPSVQMGKVLGADISEDEKGRILRHNAARLLKLDGGDVKLPQHVRLSYPNAVDVNAYLGEYPFRPILYRSAQELVEQMKRYRISQAWVSSIRAIFEDDPRESNRELLNELARYPQLKPVAVINPAMANWRRAFEEAVRSGIHAIKLHPNYHRYALSSSRASELLNEAGRVEMPVIIQLRIQDERTQNPAMIVGDSDVDRAIEAAKDAPRTKVILGGVKWSELVRIASAVRSSPNLWIDISSLERVDELREAVKMVGSEKLLFGTHAPFYYIASAVFKVEMSNISEAKRMEILTSEIAPY